MAAPMEHDAVDAPARARAAPYLVEDDLIYNMQHPRRGEALIINNKTFHPSTEMGERAGTDVDAAKLLGMFEGLGFNTTLKTNLSRQNMVYAMELMACKNFSDADCFALAVLSHGDTGVVFGTDGMMLLQDLLEPLKKCPTLVGKPKLFFIQACRGDQVDHGVEVKTGFDQLDAIPSSRRRLPEEADILLACATVPGYFAWRNQEEGSYFIQALHDVFQKYSHYESMEVMRLMTRVINKVAFEFESRSSSKLLANKKQCPSITTQLTKELYFTPKPKK